MCQVGVFDRCSLKPPKLSLSRSSRSHRLGFSYSERNIRYLCKHFRPMSIYNMRSVSRFSSQLKFNVALVKRCKRQYLCQTFGLFALYSR